MTNKPSTSRIYHSFSLKHVNKEATSKNIFGYETLKPVFSLNMQPILMTQSSNQSACRDLLKAQHDFGNRKILILTKIGAQLSYSCCLVANGKNSCCFKLQMMNAQGILAQQSLKTTQTRSAMCMLFDETVLDFAYSCDIILANASK